MRKDAWLPHDDLLLANTILRYIEQGKSQLDAFQEVGR